MITFLQWNKSSNCQKNKKKTTKRQADRQINNVLIHGNKMDSYQTIKSHRKSKSSRLSTTYNQTFGTIHQPKEQKSDLFQNNLIKGHLIRQTNRSKSQLRTTTQKSEVSLEIEAPLKQYHHNKNANFHSNYKSSLTQRKQANCFRDLMNQYNLTILKRQKKQDQKISEFLNQTQRSSYKKYQSHQSIIPRKTNKEKQLSHAYSIINRTLKQRNTSLTVVPIDCRLQIIGEKTFNRLLKGEQIAQKIFQCHRPARRLKIYNASTASRERANNMMVMNSLARYKFNAEEDETVGIQPWEIC